MQYSKIKRIMSLFSFYLNFTNLADFCLNIVYISRVNKVFSFQFSALVVSNISSSIKNFFSLL